MAVEIEVTEFREFFKRCREAARGDFRKECEQFLEALGFEFLRLIQDEIIRRKVMDTRLLLNSFHKDGDGNIWSLNVGDLTLEVGTNVHYAGYVNDGHWTNPEGVEYRFVPGSWDGDTFTHDPTAKGGIMLKQKWVPGSHYWESGLRILDQMIPGLLEEKLQEWFDNYFS